MDIEDFEVIDTAHRNGNEVQVIARDGTVTVHEHIGGGWTDSPDAVTSMWIPDGITGAMFAEWVKSDPGWFRHHDPIMSLYDFVDAQGDTFGS